MRPPDHCAYFLDIDGTLVDLAETPAGVALPRALPGLMASLYASSAGALALITGRSIADVDRLFPGRQLPAAGQHGLERRGATGSVSRHHGPSHALDRARRTLANVALRHPRLLVEDKGLSLALHYRRTPGLAGYASRVMRSLQSGLGDRYCILHGKRVVELAPAGRDKGKAIRAFMREPPFRGRTPLFIGDDVTDEFGFVVVNRLGGQSIKVGSGRTQATWRLPHVRAVIEWLERGRPEPHRRAQSRRT